MNASGREKTAVILGWMALTLIPGCLVVLAIRQSVDPWFWGVLGAGGASGLALLGLRFDEARAYFKARGTRYGGNNALVIAATLALVAFVYILVSRRHVRWDLTQNKQHSLSPQTIEILKGLKVDVEMSCFYEGGDFQEMVRDLLKEYALHTKHLKVNFYPLAQARAQAEALQIREYDTTVVQSGAKRQDLPKREVFATRFEGGRQAPEFRGEQAFSSAILKVTTQEQKKIYVTNQHGEIPLQEGGERSLSRIKESMERETHQVSELSLLAMKEPKIPDDCNLLVIAAPSADFRASEWAAINEYASKNGRLLIFVDPGIKTPAGLVKFLADHGVKSGPGLVMDPTQNMGYDPSNPVAEFGSHKIVEALRNARLPVVLLATGAFETAAGAGGYSVEGLIKSGQDSWLDTIEAYLAAVRARKMPQYQAGKKKGPLDLAVAVERAGGDEVPETQKFRMVVLGDVDLAGGALYDQLPGNANLIMNSISWLVGSEKGVTIRPKEPDVRRVPLSEGQIRSVLLIALVLTPLLFAGLGIGVYLKRRHL